MMYLGRINWIPKTNEGGRERGGEGKGGGGKEQEIASHSRYFTACIEGNV